MNAREKRQLRRWQENQDAYWKSVYKIVNRNMKREKGYLYVDTDWEYDWHSVNIWAHELNLPVLIHKGGKP